ncbi:hypothetical protein BN946_scf184790.g10 [Trametes cinnabarina]|uniref:Uncharacterized protein n=1 Tax=Pycnoporus cinnabarinus TaxID=5643 RepID=A0A060S389_PYCCI|nr:hypothetical protein BN946_scf184790.g10 [Trametes cinnabarina]
MAPANQKPGLIDKSDSSRPHIILRTLPSFSFSTPSHSVNVQLSFHASPIAQDKLRLMAISSVHPPSFRTFGGSDGTPSASDDAHSLPDRSSMTSSLPEGITARVASLEATTQATDKKVDELAVKVDTLSVKVNTLSENFDEHVKKSERSFANLGSMMINLRGDMENRMTIVDTRLNTLETRMTKLETRMTKLETQMSNMSDDLKAIRQTLNTVFILVQNPNASSSAAPLPHGTQLFHPAPNTHATASAPNLPSQSSRRVWRPLRSAFSRFMAHVAQGVHRLEHDVEDVAGGGAVTHEEQQDEEQQEQQEQQQQQPQQEQQPAAGPATTTVQTMIGQHIVDPAILNNMMA